MRATRDSFLHFLSDNLTGVTVHPVRRDPNKPDSDQLQLDAVNVQFLNADYKVTNYSQQTVSIDVTFEDELDALDVAQQLWQLLNRSFSTPKLDYSTGSPVPVGTTISWDTVARFKPIYSPLYYHYNCTLVLRHVVPLT